MKKLLTILILAILFIGCEGELKYESKPDKVMVHKTFIHPDSLEIGIEPFLILAGEKETKEVMVLQYFDKAGVEYELTRNEIDWNAVLGKLRYRWYDVYANNKTYTVGFCNSRIFTYWQSK